MVSRWIKRLHFQVKKRVLGRLVLTKSKVDVYLSDKFLKQKATNHLKYGENVQSRFLNQVFRGLIFILFRKGLLTSLARTFDNSLLEKVRQARENDIVDVISEHLSLQRKGKEFIGLCPFHQDSNPSFYVNPEKQIFKCFACGVGGDVFKFIQLRENITFSESLERLAQRAGIELHFNKHKENNKNEGDPLLLERVNKWAKKCWQANFKHESLGKVARDYAAKRNINQESIEKWELGFAVDDWDALNKAAGKAGINSQLLLEAGLAVKKTNSVNCYDKFRNRLMFPILDTTGRVIGFGGRTLAKDPAKYMNTPATALFDKSNSMYGLDKARHEIVKQGRAVVVEGYTDVIMSHQFGITNVVAALGTSFTDGHARMLKRFAREIIIVLDSDVAGMKAANRALDVCISQNIDVKIASVPMGKDPCDFLNHSGAEAFLNVIDNAKDVLEYKWEKLNESFSESDSIVKRKNSIDEFITVVSKAMNSGYLDTISKGLIIRKLSNLLGLSNDEVKKELLRVAGRTQKGTHYSVDNQKVIKRDFGGGYLEKAIKDITEVLLNEPKLYSSVKGKVDLKLIQSESLRTVFKLLCEKLETVDKFNLSLLLCDIEDIALASLVVDLAQEGETKGKYQERLFSSLNVLYEHEQVSEISKAKTSLDDDDSLKRLTSKLRDSHCDKRNRSNLRKGFLFN